MEGEEKRTHLVSDAAVGAGQRSNYRQGRRRLLKDFGWASRISIGGGFLLLDANYRQSGCRFGCCCWSCPQGRRGDRDRGRMNVRATSSVNVTMAKSSRIRLARTIGARIRPECRSDAETFLTNVTHVGASYFFSFTLIVECLLLNIIPNRLGLINIPWQTGQQAPGFRRALLAGQGKIGQVWRVQTIEPWRHWHWVHGSRSGSGVMVWPSATTVSLFHRHPSKKRKKRLKYRKKENQHKYFFDNNG